MNAKFDLKKIEKISKALGDPYRLKIMEMIRKKKECMQCTAIVETVDLAQSTVSHHMKLLVDADLVVAEKDGRNAKYHINQEVLDGYIRFLSGYKS
ncbi:MAG: transcriptional regulator, ArsR family [Bacteroidetes bacterium]|jgi:ArsR family transcriptional regulator|nr:transcriptional regulator, ArsR family [Bacteroidota bacterium]